MIGVLLRGFAADPELKRRWTLGGGVCLKKCFMETWRFPDRMTFSHAGSDPGETFRDIVQLAGRVGEKDEIAFLTDQWQVERSPDGRTVEGSVLFRSRLDSAVTRKLRIAVTSNRPVDESVTRTVYHFYTDDDPRPFAVPTLTFRELFINKTLRLAREGRPVDLYDIVHMFWRGSHMLGKREELRSLLEKKSRDTGTLLSYQDIAARMEQLRRSWHDTLEPQMRAVPPFEHFWGVLPEIFGWLDGVIDTRIAAAISLPEPGVDRHWQPPPAAWQWGAETPLEAIRFAAVNRLCIELGYSGTHRLVEPYSLRFTMDGHLLLYARKVDMQEIRTYRIDRIESIRVTDIPFVPAFAIEMSAGGPFLVQPPQPSLRGSRKQHDEPAASETSAFNEKEQTASLR